MLTSLSNDGTGVEAIFICCYSEFCFQLGVVSCRFRVGSCKRNALSALFNFCFQIDKRNISGSYIYNYRLLHQSGEAILIVS